MKRWTTHIQNIHIILGAAATLVLMVAGALGWLGWRLLSQEETLARQQAHNQLEQTADVLSAGFVRRMTDTESWLSQVQSALPSGAASPSSPAAGAVVVKFSQAGIEVQPAGQLLYYPVAPSSGAFEADLFSEANKLEFQTQDLKGAAAACSVLTANKSPMVRAEALLRLARIQNKSGQLQESIATYEKLNDEQRISPLAGEPYGLLSRFQRVQLLANSHRESSARQAALALKTDLESGQWPLSKESYASYDKEVRDLAGESVESPALPAKLAVAAAVEKLWDEWQNFQHSGSRSLTKHLHDSGTVPVIAILNANPDRLAAAIYAGEALRRLAFGPADASEQRGLAVSLVDEHDQLISGSIPGADGLQTTRPLAAADLPWHFTLTGARMGAGLLPERRWFYIVTLAGIVLLVSLACYAMARGVIREAAAGRLQSDFVSAVSHEFRSPLTTLRQLTELLAEGRIHDESRRQLYFTTLQKETYRLYQLVEDLLDFGRMDAGRRQYKIEPLDFSELVRDGVYEYQRQSNGNGHRIELNSAEGKLPVNADREALRRVVRNLLENAVKYSPDSNAVWVETGCEGQLAVLRVRDQGMGIPREEQSRIFDKFVRGEAAKQACIQGSGIGLAMVKEIVRIHHGAIDLDSEVGRGSTFMVRLPLS
jgi:two-component system, OmpR family, phosphate regulon sensor histidine kinase PhoR